MKDSSQKILDKCHKDCKTCGNKEIVGNTNCNSCNSGKYLNFGNCVDNCKYGYDADEFGNKICKCNPKCKKFSEESSKYDLCITCNDDDEYYKKFYDLTNRLGLINYYKNPEGYYLDNQMYRICYGSCRTCNGAGTLENNNCNECKESYIFKNDSGNNN